MIKNNLNNKLYIGFTGNYKKRMSDHKCLAVNPNTPRYKEPFYNAIRRDGWDNFTHDILEEFDNKSEALQREAFYIALCRTNRNKYGKDWGYNMTDGGEHPGHRVYSAETISKMSKAKLGNTLRRGSKHTKESILKMRDVKKGKIPWNKGIKQKDYKKVA
jgi:group I intron endonuclease